MPRRIWKNGDEVIGRYRHRCRVGSKDDGVVPRVGETVAEDVQGRIGGGARGGRRQAAESKDHREKDSAFVVSPQVHDTPPDVGFGPLPSAGAKKGQMSCRPGFALVTPRRLVAMNSSSLHPSERWYWCLSAHARSSLIGGNLCLEVVCTQGKFEAID